LKLDTIKYQYFSPFLLVCCLLVFQLKLKKPKIRPLEKVVKPISKEGIKQVDTIQPTELDG